MDTFKIVRSICGCLLFLMVLLTTFQANAGQRWAVFTFSTRSLERNNVETFADLFKNELSKHLNAPVVALPTTCNDGYCAAREGAKASAQYALFGSLNTLGKKILINATVVEVDSGGVVSNQSMSVDQIEDLEAAATRLAQAIAQRTSVANTAELGTITRQETEPDRRREGARGASFRVGAIVPLGSGYAEAGGGIALDLGYWFEARDFAIEPRVGVRFDTSKGAAQFIEVPFDVGAFYILSRGNFAPFIGLGAGIRFLWEDRPMSVTVGNALPATSEPVVDDYAWGFGAFGRAGFLLFRTYTMRIAMTVDYNITVATLNGHSTPQSLTFGIGLML